MNESAEKKPQLSLQKIFLKDASLETPMGIKAFQQAWQPRLNQELQTRHSIIENNLFEVILIVTLKAELGKDENTQTAFIVEVQQAGIFQINENDETTKLKLINAACPNILFPYGRETIDSLVVKAGFPAINIPPINFDALYQHAIQQQSKAAKH